MKYSLIPLFSLLFFSSAFADPCADLKDSYQNSYRKYLRLEKELDEVRNLFRSAEDLYDESFRLLAQNVEQKKISNDLELQRAQMQSINLDYNNLKMAFRKLEDRYNEKTRAFDAFQRAKDMLNDLEQAVLQCEEQNRQQE